MQIVKIDIVVQKLVSEGKMLKEININHNRDLCSHIHTLFANLETLRKLFPLYFSMPKSIHDNQH